MCVPREPKRSRSTSRLRRSDSSAIHPNARAMRSKMSAAPQQRCTATAMTEPVGEPSDHGMASRIGAKWCFAY